MILNVTFIDRHDRNAKCLHEVGRLFPSAQCRRPGYVMTLLLRSLSALLNDTEDFKLRLISASGFSPNQFVNDSSIISLIHNNRAQLSPVYATLTYPRFQLLKFLPPVEFLPLVLMTRKLPSKSVVLKISQLMPWPIIKTAGLLGVWYLTLQPVKQALNREQLYAAFYFLFGVFMKVLRSYLANLFNLKFDSKSPISK